MGEQNSLRGASAGPEPLKWDMFKIFDQVQKSTVKIVTPADLNGQFSVGSGLFVQSLDGQSCDIATVHHVTKGKNEITVSTIAGDSYLASLELSDEDHQIDIYHVKDVPNSDKVCVGAKISDEDPVANELTFTLRFPNPGLHGPTPIVGVVYKNLQAKDVDAFGGNPNRPAAMLAMRGEHGDSGAGTYNSNGEVIGLVESDVALSGFAVGIEDASSIKASLAALAKKHQQSKQP